MKWSPKITFIVVLRENIARLLERMITSSRDKMNRELDETVTEHMPYSLHAILSDCCYIMTDLFEENGFKVHKQFTAVAFMSVVDRDEMVQALTNLMRNSLRALSDVRNRRLERANGPLTMTVRTRNDGENLIIEIEDNGIGISPENQCRLFEDRFTTKSVSHGAGLGLGVSRRFVRQYGGEIEFVNSQRENATVFRIRLPVLAAHESINAAA